MTEIENKIILPKTAIKATEKNPPVLVLYGPPKVGKTTLLAQLENNLILDMEQGTRMVDALKVEINELRDIADVGKVILQEKKPYKYISVDTVDKLETFCEEAATILYKSSPAGASFTGKSVLELPSGAGYRWLRIAMRKYLDYLKSLADYLILVGHVRDKNLTKNGKEVSSKGLDLTNGVSNIVCSDASAIGYVYRSPEGELRVSFQTSEEIICGTRCKHLINADLPFKWESIYIS